MASAALERVMDGVTGVETGASVSSGELPSLAVRRDPGEGTDAGGSGQEDGGEGYRCHQQSRSEVPGVRSEDLREVVDVDGELESRVGDADEGGQVGGVADGHAEQGGLLDLGRLADVERDEAVARDFEVAGVNVGVVTHVVVLVEYEGRDDCSLGEEVHEVGSLVDTQDIAAFDLELVAIHGDEVLRGKGGDRRLSDGEVELVGVLADRDGVVVADRVAQYTSMVNGEDGEAGDVIDVVRVHFGRGDPEC